MTTNSNRGAVTDRNSLLSKISDNNYNYNFNYSKTNEDIDSILYNKLSIIIKKNGDCTKNIKEKKFCLTILLNKE